MPNVDCEWDEAKAQANIEKQGIAFADAVAVLEDDAASTRLDIHPDEDRFVTLGSDALAACSS